MSSEKKKILVVEDSATMRNLIVFSLNSIGNVSITASIHGVDAVKKMKDTNFDLIVTDINMPFMDGLKLVSYVRKNSEYDSVPIIIVTTKGQIEDRERGLKLGATAYLSKPIKIFELQKTVKKLLNPK